MDKYNADDIISLFEDVEEDDVSEDDDILRDNISVAEVDPIAYKDEDVELYPIFGVIKRVTSSDKLNDGRDKDDHELQEIDFQQKVKMLSRGDLYSHALISVDISMQKMYSFADGGLSIENMVADSTWAGTESIYVNVMFVQKDAIDNIVRFLQDIESRKDDTDYYTSGIIQQYIGKPAKDPNNFICSTFTGYVMQLADPKNTHRDYSRLRPEDITILPRAFYVDNFKDGKDFRHRIAEFKSKVDDIYSKHRDELLDYNNHLPKLLFKDKCRKLKTFDKIITNVLDNMIQ